MDLFKDLQEAISRQDPEAIERIQRKILLGNRDESIDENFIISLKGKTIHKNLARIVEGREFTDSEYAKIISSLITHTIIESEQTGRSLDDYPIKELYILLGNFINEGNGANECKRFIQERYSQFL